MLNRSGGMPRRRVVLRVLSAGWSVLAGFAAASPALAQLPPPAPPPSAGQERIYQGEATSILGRQVRDPQGEPVGRIVDVLVDDSGQPRAAVIDFGGFMGIGNRRVAVAWRALRFVSAQGHGTIALDMTTDQIKDTPEFRRPGRPEDPPVAVAIPPVPGSGPPPEPAAPAPPAPAR